MDVIAEAASAGGVADGQAFAGRARILAVWAALSGLVLLPVLLVPVPALVDYANHLARNWILARGSHIPLLSANYVVHWRLTADMAIDLVVRSLSTVMPVETAGKLFVILTVLGLIAGTAALHKALWGRVGLWPLTCVFFVYNSAFYWGLVDCLFGMGFFLLAFSLWIVSAPWRPVVRLLVFSLIACVLLLLHLFAYGLYGLAIGSYEFGLFWRRRSARRFGMCCLWGTQFLPSLVLWWIAFQNGEGTFTEYGSFAAKVYALLSPVNFGQQTVLLDWACVLIVAVFLVFALTRKWLHIHPVMRLPLVVMLIAAALMPTWLSGSWEADIRLPVALAFLGIAGSELRLPRRTAFVFAGIALLLLGLRVWGTSAAWMDYNANLREFRRAAQVITPGSRILVVEAPPTGAEKDIPGVPRWIARRGYSSYDHLPAFAVIDRAAFFPYLFTNWMPVEVAPRNRLLADGGVGPISPSVLIASLTESAADDPDLAAETHRHFGHAYWADWPRRFDYVLWIGFSGHFPSHVWHLSPVAGGSFFEIYRIERPVGGKSLR